SATHSKRLSGISSARLRAASRPAPSLTAKATRPASADQAESIERPSAYLTRRNAMQCKL
ncbi:MAG: hypothetical protein NC406_09415, partial [Bacteroides sp.]|nr:hypothetical protein [Bacteroides sp.]